MPEYNADGEKIVGRMGFWLVLPFLLFFIGAMFYFAFGSGRGASAYLLVTFVSLPALLAILNLYDANRFWWARRIIAFYLFLLYLWYALSHGVIHLPLTIHRLEPVAGLILVGLPALRYTFTGRLWVDITHLWFSRLLSPLSHINIMKPRAKSRTVRPNGKWYGAE